MDTRCDGLVLLRWAVHILSRPIRERWCSLTFLCIYWEKTKPLFIQLSSSAELWAKKLWITRKQMMLTFILQMFLKTSLASESANDCLCLKCTDTQSCRLARSKTATYCREHITEREAEVLLLFSEWDGSESASPSGCLMLTACEWVPNGTTASSWQHTHRNKMINIQKRKGVKRSNKQLCTKQQAYSQSRETNLVRW